MKKVFILVLVLVLILVAAAKAGISTNQTQVMFPLSDMFGGATYSKSFRVDAVRPLLTDGTNIYVGSYKSVTPTGGTNPVVKLSPNDYLVTFQDARTPWRISVPMSTNVLNALYLTSTNSGLPTYVYQPPLSVSGFTGVVTNLTLAAEILTPVFFYQTNYGLTVSGAGFGGVNGNYLWASDTYYGGLDGPDQIQFDGSTWHIFYQGPPRYSSPTRTGTYNAGGSGATPYPDVETNYSIVTITPVLVGYFTNMVQRTTVQTFSNGVLKAVQ